MTVNEFDQMIRSGGRHHANSWAASLLYHIVGISSVMFVMMERDNPVLLDTFRWEVSMVEAATMQPPPPPPPPTPVLAQVRLLKRFRRCDSPIMKS
jgi:hypothetical protein